MRKIIRRNLEVNITEPYPFDHQVITARCTNKITLLSFLMVIPLMFAGCASTRDTGKLDGFSIKKDAVTYYSGKYVGKEKDCFPPITKPICKSNPAYEIDKKLEMERFTIELSSKDSSKVSEDRLYLVASELALQEGYTMFTVLGGNNFSTCSSVGVTAKTYGTYTPDSIGGGTYVGSTSVSRSSTCLFSKTINVLYFRHKTDLANGVLLEAPFWNNKEIHPEETLYLGTTPGVSYTKHNYVGGKAFYYTKENAWKTHYDAAGLSNELLRKFKLTTLGTIHFTDELSVKQKEKEEDSIERWRVTDP